MLRSEELPSAGAGANDVDRCFDFSTEPPPSVKVSWNFKDQDFKDQDLKDQETEPTKSNQKVGPVKTTGVTVRGWETE